MIVHCTQPGNKHNYNIVLFQQGSFPPPCGPEAVCSLLDEDSLLKYCKEGCSSANQRTAFRYFVLDGSIIVALLEQPLGNDEGMYHLWNLTILQIAALYHQVQNSAISQL